MGAKMSIWPILDIVTSCPQPSISSTFILLSGHFSFLEPKMIENYTINSKPNRIEISWDQLDGHADRIVAEVLQGATNSVRNCHILINFVFINTTKLIVLPNTAASN